MRNASTASRVADRRSPPALPKPAQRPDRMTRRSTALHMKAKLSLEGEIAHLGALDLKGLRARWQSVMARQVPPHFPRHLIIAMLAYRLQADALGDLDPETTRLLKKVGVGG